MSHIGNRRVILYLLISLTIPLQLCLHSQESIDASLKSELIKFYENNYPYLPTKEYLSELSKKGDVFTAAREILDGEVKICEQGSKDRRLYIYSLNILRALRDDPRAMSLYRKFLDLPTNDYRWHNAVIVTLLNKDEIGEKKLKEVLFSNSTDRDYKSSALQLIAGYGQEHWLDILRRIEMTADEKKSGLEPTLRNTIEALNRKEKKKKTTEEPNKGGIQESHNQQTQTTSSESNPPSTGPVKNTTPDEIREPTSSSSSEREEANSTTKRLLWGGVAVLVLMIIFVISRKRM